MLCPACHKDCFFAEVCPHCGASLLSVQGQTPTGDPFNAKANSDAIQRLKSILAIGAAGAAWTLIVYLSYLRTIRWSGGVRNPESSGYFVGGLLTPALVAAFVVWLINRGRKDKMSLVYKQLLTAFLALGITLVSFAGSLRQPAGINKSFAKKQMGHLMKQAAGKEAVTPDSEWYEGPSRQFFRDILAFNQEYTDAIQSIDQSRVAKLYTPESYATRAGMSTTIAQLHALLDADKKYESLEPVLKKMEVNISATSASEFQKEEFLEGFRSSTGKALAPRGETFRTEEEWLQSSIHLYEFTLAHFADYKVQGQKLTFQGHRLVGQFQDLQSKSIAFHRIAIESKHKLDAGRKDALSQAGVTPADISGPPPKEK